MDGSVSAGTMFQSAVRVHGASVVLWIVLALAFALSFLIGPMDLSPGALLDGLFTGHGAAGVIAREIRLPRAGLGVVVGAAL
ncbi:MAG TPA: hypothetical protein VGB91_16190, partial [Rhizomicrobium sp.]